MKGKQKDIKGPWTGMDGNGREWTGMDGKGLEKTGVEGNEGT